MLSHFGIDLLSRHGIDQKSTVPASWNQLEPLAVYPIEYHKIKKSKYSLFTVNVHDTYVYIYDYIYIYIYIYVYIY